MNRFLSVFFLASGLLLASGANSSVTISAVESGGDVVFTYSGSINTNTLTFVQATSSGASSFSADGFNNTDPVVGRNLYSGVTSSPTGFYTGSGSQVANSNNIPAGGSFAINALRITLAQTGYTSGATFTSTMTYSGQTLSSLSLVLGTYVWTLANGETVTLIIGTSAVPTLSEWSQMLLGLMVLSMIGWHFHRQRLN